MKCFDTSVGKQKAESRKQKAKEKQKAKRKAESKKKSRKPKEKQKAEKREVKKNAVCIKKEGTHGIHGSSVENATSCGCIVQALHKRL